MASGTAISVASPKRRVGPPPNGGSRIGDDSPLRGRVHGGGSSSRAFLRAQARQRPRRSLPVASRAQVNASLHCCHHARCSATSNRLGPGPRRACASTLEGHGRASRRARGEGPCRRLGRRVGVRGAGSVPRQSLPGSRLCRGVHVDGSLYGMRRRRVPDVQHRSGRPRATPARRALAGSRVRTPFRSSVRGLGRADARRHASAGRRRGSKAACLGHQSLVGRVRVRARRAVGPTVAGSTGIGRGRGRGGGRAPRFGWRSLPSTARARSAPSRDRSRRWTRRLIESKL